jgi:hypothetical protein
MSSEASVEDQNVQEVLRKGIDDQSHVMKRLAIVIEDPISM